MKPRRTQEPQPNASSGRPNRGLLASITIKVTLDQQEELLEKSKHQKISVSEVIRRLIFEPPADGDASGTETPPSELEKKITQMQYILADMKTLAKEAKK